MAKPMLLKLMPIAQKIAKAILKKNTMLLIAS